MSPRCTECASFGLPSGAITPADKVTYRQYVAWLKHVQLAHGRTYAETMTHPQAGDFGLRKGGGAAMAAVRWATGAPRWSWGRFWRVPAAYGHAALVIGYDPVASPDAPVQIIEAAPAGVRMQWVREDFFTWSAGGPLVLDEAQRTAVVATAWSVITSDYDWPSILEFAPRFFYGKFTGHFASRPDDKLFCSELVVWAYRLAGVSFAPAIPDAIASGAVAPQQLAAFLP